MTSIDLVMFDLGRVLVDFDFKKAVRNLKVHSPLAEEDIHAFFKHTPLWDAFEKGKVEPPAFFDALTKELKLKGLTFEQFKPLWNDIFTEKTDTIEILKELKKRYRTALVSNVNVLHWEFVWDRYGFMKWFDLPIASYAVGHRKPGTEIYRITLERAGVKPERSVFVDDVESHITSARSIGIQAVQFHSAEQLRKDWQGLLS
jgi:epoxide hydrolase-like predicted phosphatase